MLTTLCRPQAGETIPRSHSLVAWGFDIGRDHQPYFVNFVTPGTDRNFLSFHPSLRLPTTRRMRLNPRLATGHGMPLITTSHLE